MSKEIYMASPRDLYEEVVKLGPEVHIRAIRYSMTGKESNVNMDVSLHRLVKAGCIKRVRFGFYSVVGPYPDITTYVLREDSKGRMHSVLLRRN